LLPVRAEVPAPRARRRGASLAGGDLGPGGMRGARRRPTRSRGPAEWAPTPT